MLKSSKCLEETCTQGTKFSSTKVFGKWGKIGNFLFSSRGTVPLGLASSKHVDPNLIPGVTIKIVKSYPSNQVHIENSDMRMDFVLLF